MADDPVMAPLIEAAKAVARDGRANHGWPAGQTVTLVVSVRPDDHGRAAAIGIDLLDSGNDAWEGDKLVLHRCWR